MPECRFPFLLRARHSDWESPHSASSGGHVWALFRWVKVYDGWGNVL